MHNSNIWVPRFKHDFIPAIRRIEDVFLQRLQPTFASIGAESEKLKSDLWDEASAIPCYDGDLDEGQIAESVETAAVSHYLSLKGMEQGLLNCCALFLYHSYEQHLMLFLRQELLGWKERNNKRLYTHDEARNRLKLANVDITKFASWPKIEELRHLANTIKHGEGKSSEVLALNAPHLFEIPVLINGGAVSAPVYRPLLGEDICVTPKDIHDYANALESFWLEMGQSLVEAVE